MEKSELKPPFVIFEVQEEGERNLKYLRVKLHEGTSVAFGRSTETGIHLKSATVSRNHFAIYYTHKQLFIKDLGSKFGTFVYSPNALYDFGVDSGISVLVDNSLLHLGKWEGFNLRTSLSMPTCCGNSMKMYLKVEEDKEDKFTHATAANINLFDFFD